MIHKNVFIAPGSKEHINKSVIPSEVEEAKKLTSLQGLIPIENIADTLTEEERKRLEEIYPDKKVRMWGTRPGLKRIWDSLSEEGDFIVFYSDNYYVCTAETAFKTANSKLAQKVWGRYKTGETWEYIFFVKNVRELNIHRKEFNKKVGYEEDFVPQGFMRVRNEEAGKRIIEEMILKKAPGAMPTFSFATKDFESCTGKKADARYLSERFKTLLGVLKENLDPSLREFTKGYAARPYNQGSKKYRDHMWLGLAHGKLKQKPQKCTQFQASITSNQLSIDIFIDRAGRDARREAKSNIEKDKVSFLKQISNLDGYFIGYLNEEQFEIETDKMTENDLNVFLEHIGKTRNHVYVSKVMTKKETIDKGTLIVDEIIKSWKQLLPIYTMMAFGEFEKPVVVIQPLNLQPSLIKTRLMIDEDVLGQVCANLNSGSHVIITGPVGTGKTSLTEDVCRAAIENKFCNGYVLTTATSDWTTFGTIGGYMPTEEGRLKFEEGKFLEAIRENKLLVIDEINRADIDKAFGQLFTVLSGQRVELPFKHSNGKTISIETTTEDRSYFDDEAAAYKVGRNWRIIATMNVYDMNFLFEMSYAFMRRFAFVYLDAPEKFEELIDEWCRKKKISDGTKEKLKKLTRLREKNGFGNNKRHRRIH